MTRVNTIIIFNPPNAKPTIIGNIGAKKAHTNDTIAKTLHTPNIILLNLLIISFSRKVLNCADTIF